MRLESLPPIKTIYHALENAASDVFGFAVVCHGGAPWMAEPDVLDVLLLGLENAWLVEGEDGGLSHREFREEIFQAVWNKCRDRSAPVRVGTDVPLGHQEMAFYHLSQRARAAVFLRTKKRFPYSSIAMVLGITEGAARAEVESARELLLGRRIRGVDIDGDSF